MKSSRMEWLCAVLIVVSLGYFSWVLRVCDEVTDETPAPEYHQVRRGIASWYRASGMVCASRLYPIGSTLRVCHGQQAIFVTVVTRGPAWRFFRRGRIIDLSLDAFRWLAAPKFGLIDVTVERVP